MALSPPHAHREPYRDAPPRAQPASAPTRELVHVGGNPTMIVALGMLLSAFSAFGFVHGSRVVEADCAHLDDEISCDVVDSNFLFTTESRARARDVTSARVETIHGAKGSKRSRLWLLSDTGKTPVTDWYSGDASGQAQAAYAVTMLAIREPPARTSFRFGSRWSGVLPAAIGLLFVGALVATGWQRVRLSHSPSDGIVEIERSSLLQRRSSAVVSLGEIDGVAIETVPRARARAGYRLELVLKDLTRVEVATVLTSSRRTIAEEQRRLASWLGVAAIG